MALSRNNHYIPRMYLAYWGENKKIWVYKLLVPDEKVPLWSPKSIKYTASFDNLYVNYHNDAEYDDIEHYIAENVEDQAKDVIDKICANKELTSNDWEILSVYVAVQYIRTPGFYMNMRELCPGAFSCASSELNRELTVEKNLTSEHLSGSNSNLIPIDVKPIKENDGSFYLQIGLVLGKGVWLNQIIHTLSEDSVLLEWFKDYNWSVVTAPDDKKWPTCDNPVVLCDTKDDQIIRVAPTSGLSVEDRAVIFPVSPEKALIGANSRQFPRYMQADDSLYTMIKRAIADNALLYIYSSEEDVSMHTIRKRVVDVDEYRRVKAEFDNWHDNYKAVEGPLLKG